MKLNEYQELAMNFAKFKCFDYPFLALSEEVGEVSGKLAKYTRKHDTTLSDAVMDASLAFGTNGATLQYDLANELGDVLWQLTACCRTLGISLEELAQINLDKLADRDSRDVIVGEGDKR